ncbi:MAG: aspartoacylase [Oculatellaceae cyanobacterium bins.114]|nr:aspartoacylase [Oculatellaceae cyanobacterium bins.114]
MQKRTLNRVLLAGATHGNELIGAFLIKKFEKFPDLIARSSFETQTLFGNPDAFAANVRYIDKDLNRSFNRQDATKEELLTYEELRARDIEQLFGSQGKTPADVIVDLHSTTANMGLTLIIDTDDVFTLQLVAYLSSVHPSIQIYHSANSGRGQDSLRSLGQFGLGIEVGPIAQGVLIADLFLKTEALIYTTLNYLEQINTETVPFFNQTLTQPLTIYRYIKAIDYPRDQLGEIQAMIHPQLQFKDYQPLHPGDPIFLTFDGQVIIYEEPSTVYPIFINEAAYYEKGIAMYFTEKQQITV